MGVWLHSFVPIRLFFIAFFSLTAVGLLTYQSIAIFHAFVDFVELFRRE